MGMRAFGAIMLCLVLAWCFVPFSTKPSGSHWSYDSGLVENHEKFERARAAGRIHEDPERHRLRQAVLNAGSRLHSSPCDPSIKPVLVAASAALLLHMRQTGDEPRETVAIEGETLDAAPFLNTDAAEVIREAKNGGILHSEDFTQEIANLFPATPPDKDSHWWYGGAFACRNGYPADHEPRE